MADGTEMTVLLKRTRLGLKMLYLDLQSSSGHKRHSQPPRLQRCPILVPPSSPRTGQISDYLAPELDHDPDLQK